MSWTLAQSEVEPSLTSCVTSAFGVEIGILTVGLWYEDLFLGPAQTASAVNLTAGVNNLHLVGRLVPYTNDPAALEKLSVVFSRYLNGESTPVQARGLTVNLPSGENISWLSAGIKALTLNVPLISPTGRISPITGIDIKALSLEFDSAQPYAPMANSSQVTVSDYSKLSLVSKSYQLIQILARSQAGFGLPFGFSLDIVELANSYALLCCEASSSGADDVLFIASPSSTIEPQSPPSRRRSACPTPPFSLATRATRPARSILIFLSHLSPLVLAIPSTCKP